MSNGEQVVGEELTKTPKLWWDQSSIENDNEDEVTRTPRFDDEIDRAPNFDYVPKVCSTHLGF